MVTFQVNIEPDDNPRSAGKYMVVIRKTTDQERGVLVGIPLRDASKEQAYIMLPHLRWAFEFGVHALESELLHVWRHVFVERP